MRKFIILILFNSLFSQIVETSSEEMPEWVKTPPSETDEFIYAVGVATQFERFEVAEKNARLNALNKIWESYFGLEVQHKYLRVRENFETYYLDSLKIESKAEIWGISLVDWYWKKYMRVISNEIKYFYDVWVLMRVRKKELEEAVNKFLEKNEEYKAKIEEEIKKSKEYLNEKKIGEILLLIDKINKLISEFKGEKSYIYKWEKEIEVVLKDLRQNLIIQPLNENKEIKRNKKGLVKIEIKVMYKGRAQQEIPVYVIKENDTISVFYSDENGICRIDFKDEEDIFKKYKVKLKIGYDWGNEEEFIILPPEEICNLKILIETIEDGVSPGPLSIYLMNRLNELEIKCINFHYLNFFEKIFLNRRGFDYTIYCFIKIEEHPIIEKWGVRNLLRASGCFKIIDSKNNFVHIEVPITNEKRVGEINIFNRNVYYREFLEELAPSIGEEILSKFKKIIVRN